MRWFLLVVLCGCLVGCRGEDGPSDEEREAREAAVQMLAQVSDGQYADVWTSLHPAYQEVIPEEQLVDCGMRFPAAFVKYEINEAELDDYNADEIGTVDAWQVSITFELIERFADPSGTPGLSTRSLILVQDGDEWHWFPATGELQTFRDGNCGLPWPGASA